jgi:hypothetical protein
VKIRIKGHLDQSWSEWFDGLSITHTGQGESILTGTLVDQAALYGFIAGLRDLGLPLISVNLFDAAGSVDPPLDQHHSPAPSPPAT